MTVLPVIARELRVAARRTSTYTLRMNGVVALLAVCVWLALNPGVNWNEGGAVFAYLHAGTFVAIWVLVPLVTADCISRERREGTLPLLFLTPLKARDIVLAKGLAHGLTALSLWLAVLPVVTIPFITGGLGWREALYSILVNFSSICLALGAGLAASAHSKVHGRALLLAGCLAFVFCLGFIVGTGVVGLGVFCGMAPGSGHSFLAALTNLDEVISGGTALALDAGGTWQRAGFFGQLVMLALGISTGLSVVAFCAFFALAAWRVKQVWREPPPSARRVWLERKLCTPVLFRRVFCWWMGWELERNPVGWLERRTWSGRLVSWGWLGLVILFYTYALTSYNVFNQGSLGALERILAWFLAGSVALSAAGSFRRERESGLLELLLVAPLKEWQVVGGRVRGLWAQFLPAVALLLGLWLYCSRFAEDEGQWVFLLCFAGTFLSLPVIGLYYSLVKRAFLGAFLWTLLVGVALPAFLADAARLIILALSLVATTNYPYDLPILWMFTPIQAAVAAITAGRLHSALKGRSFAVQGAA